MNWSDTSITLAKEKDISAITKIYNEYIGEANMDTEAIGEEYYHHFYSNQTSKERLFVLKFKREIIAWSQIKKYSHKKGYRLSCETSTYISKPFRNLGLGSKFKKYIIVVCDKLGYKHIVARILIKNQISIDYNLKLGYEIVGVQKNVGYINGKWEDVMVMQYNFK